MSLLLGAVLICALIAALGLFGLARRASAHTGLPINARVVYADTGSWRPVERPFYSAEQGLTGKPDNVVELEGSVIPVEVKPNRAAEEPREADVMQLAAYAFLVEEAHNRRVPFGLLKYRNAVFQIEWNSALRTRLFTLMQAMREGLREKDLQRNHSEVSRCHACAYRAECGQAL